MNLKNTLKILAFIGLTAVAGLAQAQRAYPVDVEDRDLGLAMNPDTKPGDLCKAGISTAKYPLVASSCAQAIEDAEKAGAYEDAMRFAAIACVEQGTVYGCRRLTRLPAEMTVAGRQPTSNFKSIISEAAGLVCDGKARIKNGETDVTGRECGSFAKAFGFLSHPEYQYTVDGAGNWHRAIYDKTRSTFLYRKACMNLGHKDSCEDMKAVSGAR